MGKNSESKCTSRFERYQVVDELWMRVWMACGKLEPQNRTPDLSTTFPQAIHVKTTRLSGWLYTIKSKFINKAFETNKILLSYRIIEFLVFHDYPQLIHNPCG